MSTKKQTIDWYNNNANRYDEHLQSATTSPFHAYYEKPAIFSLLPNLKSLRVINLGCGSGRDSKKLLDAGADQVTGIDISKNLIDISRKNFPNIEVVVGDIEKLPFKSESFDIAYSSLVLHYLPTYEKALKEAFRVLRPGGTMVFSVGHPIFLSLENIAEDETKKDRRLGIYMDKIQDKEYVYGDYLSASELRTNNPDLDVTSYSQPLSYTINQIADAGFTIKKCIEPIPTEEFKKIDAMNYLRLSKIPYFVVFKLHKPN